MAHLKDIPILMYHHVASGDAILPEDNSFLSLDDFKAQTTALSAAGYTTIDFLQLADISDEKVRPPEKPVIISIDDGYAETLKNVMTVLQRNGQKAVVGLVTGCVGGFDDWQKARKEYYRIIDAGLVKEYAKSCFSFVSHSETHRFLSSLEGHELEKELTVSKQDIENMTGKPVNALIYPYGDRDDKVKEALSAAGYRFGVAISAKTKYVLEDPYDLRRVYIKKGDSVRTFMRKISPWYLWYRGLRRR